VNAIIEDTLALRDYDLRMSQIEVSLELSENLPEVSADPHQLQQVFLNLINNAVDAILEVGTVGQLRARTGAEQNYVFVEFTDSGPGVKDASRVFDPFYTTKPVGKGTGLGLSICYGIITEHGGRILVKNAPQRGATFRIELPLQASRTPTTEGQKSTASRHLKSGRILVVEADQAAANTIARVLTENDHAVELASSMAQARKLAAEREFDLVVADWSLAVRESTTQPGAENDQGGHGLGQRVLWTAASIAENGSLRLPTDSVVVRKPVETEQLIAAVEARLVGVATALLQE